LDAKWLGFASTWKDNGGNATEDHTAAYSEEVVSGYSLFPGQLLALAEKERNDQAANKIPAKRADNQSAGIALSDSAKTWATTWSALDNATLLAFHQAANNGDQTEAVYKWYFYAQEFHSAVAAWWTEWDNVNGVDSGVGTYTNRKTAEDGYGYITTPGSIWT
jgi:hypothetical protein